MTEPLQEGFCRTRACLAGHVVLAQGFQFQGQYARVSYYDGTGHPRNPVLENADGVKLAPDWTSDTDIGTIEEFAADYLGLTEEWAEELFSGNNDLEDLATIVQGLSSQPDRSEQSRARLREALQLVVDAEKQGRWNQDTWFEVLQS